MRYCYLILALFAFTTLVQAYASNMPNGYAGQPPSGANCVNCHSSYQLNSGNGSLQISGLPTGGYQPGSTYTVIIILADPGQMRWGFECTSIYQSGSSYLQAGTFTVTDPTHTALGVGSGTAPDYMKHISAGTYPGTPGPTSWSFNWTAPNPAVGTIGFYASGAACNNTGGTSGDYCYTNSTQISPVGSIPAVDITLTPIGAPIVIPPQGGSFNFNVNIANNSGSTQNFDGWIMIQLPSGSWYGPVLGPVNLTMPTSASITRLRTQNIAATSPPGTYLYQGYVGVYATSVKWDSSSFTFSKSGMGNGIVINDFRNYGEEFEPWIGASSETPSSFIIMNAFPNPFNPSTVARYQIPDARQVTLKVYDTTGRLITTLAEGWREAGEHQVTFDGSALTSGMYLCRLTAGNISAVSKLMLVK